MDSNERKIVQELVTALGCVIPASDGYEPKTNLWNKYSAAKNMLAAAPQVVADERELPVATWFAIDHADGVQFHPSEEQALRYSESGQCVKYFSEDQMRAALQAAPVQAQEPEHVPVHPGHFPLRDPSKPAEQQGVFKKFDVWRTDGSSAPGGKHRECRYFVLDVDHDALAKPALQAYAAACAATHPDLSADMVKRFDLAPVQPVAVLDGWPTAEMAVRGAEQLHDCLRSAGVEHDFDANLRGTEIQQDIAESVFKSMIELAAPAAQGDAWLEKCEALIDIWDDGNKPEDERAYFSGAFPEMLEEIRAAIAAKAVNP